MTRSVAATLTGSPAHLDVLLAGSHARFDTRGPIGGRPGLRRVLLGLLCGAALLGGCVQASQIYPLSSPPGLASPPTGSIQIERIEGDQRLLGLKVEALAPPASWGVGYTTFVVWVEDSRGRAVKVGALRYDRARRSGTLLGTVDGIDFQAFTVRVTVEREAEARVPGGVLLGERHVKNQ